MNDRRERNARGLLVAAHYASRNPAFLPIFERMEREQAAGAIETPLDRARRIARGT